MPNSRPTSIAVLGITPRLLVAMQPAAGGALAWASTPVPPGSIEGATVVDSERLAQAIRALLRKLGVRERQIRVALPPQWYSMRTLRLPELPKAERRAVVRGELEQSGGIPYGRGAFDFVWMSGAAEGQADVYAYFVSDTLMQGLSETMDLAGYRIAAVEPASLASVRAYLGGVSTPASVAVLYPEAHHSDLAIHDGTSLRHLRRIPVGYADLREQLIPAVSFEPPPVEEPEPVRVPQFPPMPDPALWAGDSEVVKTEREQAPVGPEGTGSEPPTGSPVPQPEATVVFAPREQDMLTQEVQRTLAYYARESDGAPPAASLVVIGPSDVLRQVTTALGYGLEIPVEAVEVVKHLPLSPTPQEELPGPDCAALLFTAGVAVGLARGDLGIPQLHIGKQDVRARVHSGRVARRWLMTGLASGTLCLVVAMGAAGVLGLRRQELAAELGQVRSQISLLEAQQAPLVRYKKVRDEVLVMHRRSQSPAAAVLGRIAAAANTGIQFKTISLSAEGVVQITGDALNSRSIQRLAQDLTLGPTLRAPTINSVRRQESGTLSFSMTAQTGPERPEEPAPPRQNP